MLLHTRNAYTAALFFTFDTILTALPGISIFLKVLCALLALNVIRIQKWSYLTFCPLYLNGDNVQQLADQSFIKQVTALVECAKIVQLQRYALLGPWLAVSPERGGQNFRKMKHFELSVRVLYKAAARTVINTDFKKLFFVKMRRLHTE